MKSIVALIVFKAAFTLAQCEAPVPCTDPTLNALEASDCQKYHIFVARGSDSGYPGHNGPLIVSICDKLDDCGYEDIIYPANSSYAGVNAWCKSAHIGSQHAQEQMKSYAEKCPDAKLILLGYSQGASVALDTLGGGGGPVFKCEQEENGALDRTQVPGSNIAAAVVFGAAVRTAGQPYTATGAEKLRGGSNFNGTSPRSEAHLAGLKPYSNILREYCNFGDPVCAVGSEPQDVAQHLNYFKLYVEDAAVWIVDTVQGKFETRKNLTILATTSSAATKATVKPTSTLQSQTTSVHVDAAASTRTPQSMATKPFVVSGSIAVFALGYSALLFLL